MAYILALDTSVGACSVALLGPGREVTERFELAAQSHTRRALPMIDQLLDETGISLQQLDAIAYSAGPGSFTGLRIGMGIVQGLAFAADKPVLPVSTLAAMAWRAYGDGLCDQNVCVLPALDARMGEVYWAAYQLDAGSRSLRQLQEPSVGSPGRLLDALSEHATPIFGVGNGWSLDELSGTGIAHRHDYYPRAGAIAELGLRAFQDGCAQSVLTMEPTYVRNKVSWKKRQRIRTTRL